MVRSIVCLAAVLALGGCATLGSAAPTSAGARVLAEWEETGIYWAGSVTGVSDGVIAVAFDDGTFADRRATQVRPLDWAVGSRLACAGVVGEIVAYVPATRALTLQTQEGGKLAFTTGDCTDQRDAPAAST
ncbi:MAG: tudor domain-containing protein [Brevundimonas sp.]|uniref:tudor domain-containing protein n=1 Tax=Brevundimonas sp. TaxID=1871086 RepID=UPI002732A717|nr:tudor domain-containing protein [Brevundimonas sp.]MDP3405402.1 tudor domain-containing protein [Brevundimonas sp.]